MKWVAAVVIVVFFFHSVNILNMANKCLKIDQKRREKTLHSTQKMLNNFQWAYKCNSNGISSFGLIVSLFLSTNFVICLFSLISFLFSWWFTAGCVCCSFSVIFSPLIVGFGILSIVWPHGIKLMQCITTQKAFLADWLIIINIIYSSWFHWFGVQLMHQHQYTVAACHVSYCFRWFNQWSICWFKITSQKKESNSATKDGN